MLFRSDTVSKTWDSWIYFHEGVYYLYYLISEQSVGDGFGLATSQDGVHWQDEGWVLQHSEKMVRYLGSGSVWKDVQFKNTGRFICNFSEWHMDGDTNVQNIFFAYSDDLRRWQKFAEDDAFRIDERFYQRVKPGLHQPWEDPRWDCISVIPRPEDGYYGYWTATPKDFLGFGFGFSQDGLHWEALEPPQIDWGEAPRMYFIEVGGVHEIEGRYYAMLADYASVNCGIFCFESDTPFGPWRPSAKNFALLRNQSKMHAYFTRFCDSPDGVLVNHHTLAEGQFMDNLFAVYYAPLKRARLINGSLYLTWWEGNDQLKGRQVELDLSVETIQFDAQQGIVLEGEINLPGKLLIHCDDTSGTGILVDDRGITEIGPIQASWTGFKCEERVDREIDFSASEHFRLLLNRTMLEFYIDDIFIQCYTMEKPANGKLSSHNVERLTLWQW